MIKKSYCDVRGTLISSRYKQNILKKIWYLKSWMGVTELNLLIRFAVCQRREGSLNVRQTRERHFYNVQLPLKLFRHLWIVNTVKLSLYQVQAWVTALTACSYTATFHCWVFYHNTSHLLTYVPTPNSQWDLIVGGPGGVTHEHGNFYIL